MADRGCLYTGRGTSRNCSDNCMECRSTACRKLWYWRENACRFVESSGMGPEHGLRQQFRKTENRPSCIRAAQHKPLTGQRGRPDGHPRHGAGKTVLESLVNEDIPGEASSLPKGATRGDTCQYSGKQHCFSCPAIVNKDQTQYGQGRYRFFTPTTSDRRVTSAMDGEGF